MNRAFTDRPNADILPEEAGGASLLKGHYLPLPADGGGKLWVRTAVVIQSEAKILYEMWRDVESASNWHERVVEVRAIGQNTYHWVMRDEPGDKTLELDFEILSDEPGKRIAWRSVSGEPHSAGVVIFERAPGGRGTLVTVVEQFHTGKIDRLWKAITGRDPKQSAIENLRHFKAMSETGEIPRAEPQPHGHRRLTAKVKRSAYGEEIGTPPGANKAATGAQRSHP